MGYGEPPTNLLSISTPMYYYLRQTLKFFRGEPAISEVG